MLAGVVVFGLAGCDTISEHTNAYLGLPKYPPTQPAAVQILTTEPKQPKERLGEITLFVEGTPSRDELEDKLKKAAARLGADAVFVVYDKTHIFPLVYYGWWGPGWVSEDPRRQIVAVAIKYK